MKGRGSVRYRRRDGLWEARISMKRSDGKRIYRSEYFKSEREAYEGLDRMRGKYANLTKGDVSLRAHLVSWLTRHEDEWAEATQRLRLSYVERILIPWLGFKSLNSITVRDVDGLMTTLQREGKSASTRAAILRTLSTALNDAVRQDIITKNVAARAHKPKVVVKRDHILDVHEARHLLEVAKDSPYYALYAVAITGGLRQGEIFALLWENVDFTRSAVSVEATLAEDRNGNLVRKEPKTRQSRREVVLPKIAMDALHRHPRMGNFVFTDSYGNPLRKSNFLRREFHPL